MPTLLSINNYYYRRGGSEAVYFEHNRLFEESGWQVVPFSMHDDANLASPWSKYFADATEGGPSKSGKIHRAATAIYSFQAARRLRALIDLTQPAVAHAHNIYHHLSPSVLVELKRKNVPIVMTLHDLKLACPAYKMYTQGRVCESCRGGALRNVIKNRCIKDSLSMSALVWLESTVHRSLNLYLGCVDRFVVPSRFFLRKFAEWGLDTSRFVHIPNSVTVESAPELVPVEDVFVYAGRLVPEKGVATLIKAAAQARIKLKIIGTGSEEIALQQLARESGGQIEFTGYMTGERLRNAIAAARAVVVPSEWYENAPLSVMEASALGRPVIGADIGGIPELIRCGETGFGFQSGEVDSLAAALARVQEMPLDALAALGENGREWMRAEFSAAAYRDRMFKLYAQLGAPHRAAEAAPIAAGVSN